MTSPRNWNSGVAIMLVLLVTGLVLLWDVTHQQIPVTSAPQPTAAEGSEGWVVVVGKTSEGGVIFIAHNLTHFTEHQLETPSLDEGFQFAVASHWVVVANNTQVRLIDLATEYKEDYEVENVSHLALGFQMDGTPVIVSSTDAGLFGMVMGGGNITLPTPPGKIMDLEIHNNRLAMVCADKPDTIRLGWLGSDILSEFQPDPRATPEEDLFLLEHGGVEVNYSTIRVVNITLDERWVVAAVNVTAVDRLVMFDQLSGEIRLLGDPKYPVCEPDVGHGIVTWSAQRFLDPLHPDKAMLDHDIWFHNIETNRTILIPDEDDVDQRFPHSLSNHITWMEYSSGNEKLIIFPIEKPLEGYSSITLQVTVLLLLPLVTLHTWRRSVGWRASIPHKNE